MPATSCVARPAGVRSFWLGFAAYLALWVATFIWVWRRLCFWRQEQQWWLAALTVGVMGMIVHLSVHNFFDNLYVQGIYLQIALWFVMIQSEAG